eukprot:3774510-Pleurochrysis_carterae.AAC.2
MRSSKLRHEWNERRTFRDARSRSTDFVCCCQRRHRQKFCSGTFQAECLVAPPIKLLPCLPRQLAADVCQADLIVISAIVLPPCALEDGGYVYLAIEEAAT